MSVIQGLEDIRSMSRFAFESAASRKECMQSLLDRFYSLIDARQFVSKDFIYKIAGIEDKVFITKSKRGNICKTRLSYLQLYNVLVKFAQTGRLMKNSYKITNKQKLSVL